MSSSNVCPTDDAIQAFLEYLAYPMLPAKSSVRDNPTSSQQQSVANQVHSVVLLYNYYYRRQHPELPFFPFDEFCKLAVVLKPTLLAYMNFMQQCSETELNDVEKQLSVVEKTIMDACDICNCLDASKNVPNIEGWPIAKVTVLLIDCKKEKCFLLYNSITKGVWSVIEKDVDISNPSSDDTKGAKSTLKKKRVIRKHTKEKLNSDEAGLLEAGYSAVKEAVGIDQTDVMLLESHTLYSHSKEKTTSIFFIMQCSHLIDQEVIQLPIKDVIDSLQGPLIKKSASSWTVTPAVEHFHLLPYSKIISEWFSRGTFSNSLQGSRMAEKIMMVGNPKRTESCAIEDISMDLDIKPSRNNTEFLKQEENNQNCAGILSYCNRELQSMDVKKENCSLVPFQEKEKCQYFGDIVLVCKDQETKNSSVQNYPQGSASAPKVVTTRTLITDEGAKNLASCNKTFINNSSIEDSKDRCTLITSQSNSNNVDLERFQNFLALKGEILSQTSLKILHQRRNELVLQQQKIEDEIALCNNKIETILNGGEGALELKIESIIEGCNNKHGMTSQNLEEHFLPPCIKRKRLSEAVLLMQSPCQELDGICHENNWILPTYRVSSLDGGFEAKVTVKGTDFECSCGGSLCLNPREARESAATQILAELRSTAKSTQN
ncbi:hypothetical protein QN277_003126 [Acacia crassicarpa]|uniref:DRBM domain-containing protein n=1 Tax=Acacia crassicarpa TaxID=499986 RepID=A0AAE1TIP1_9FABA|nr:hypothetical protein QN277_003126 [Acacia crassicarpa]